MIYNESEQIQKVVEIETSMKEAQAQAVEICDKIIPGENNDDLLYEGGRIAEQIGKLEKEKLEILRPVREVGERIRGLELQQIEHGITMGKWALELTCLLHGIDQMATEIGMLDVEIARIQREQHVTASPVPLKLENESGASTLRSMISLEF